MKSDIDEVVRQCATCQERQCSQQAETLQPHEILDECYSIVRKIPMGQFNSQTVVNLTKQMFSEHGVPQRVVGDNGSQYDNKTYRKFAKEWNFDHITSSPHYARSNGFIERSI